MSVKRQIMEVGFDKNGEAEFGVCMDVLNLSLEKMNELRRMTCVAIGTMEDIWRRERFKALDMQCKEAKK